MPTLTKTAKITLLLLFIVIIGAGFVTYELTSPTGYYARQHADLVAIQKTENQPYINLEGEAIDVADFQGKPLIINAWASWSPFTKSDHELLAKLKETHGDRVTIVAMNRMETKETAQAYLDMIGRRDGIIYLVDPDDQFFKTVEGYAMPETLFYDAVGNIRFHVRGSLRADELESNATAILENKSQN